MTIREAIKEQRKSIKNRSAKEQLSFFWEYYGIKTICLLLAVIAVIAFVVTMVTKKEYALTGVFFGATQQTASESYLSEFGQLAGIDPEEYQMSVQCHPDIQMDQQITQEIYQSMETFTAMVSGNSVDCFAGNSQLFLYYAYMEYALDLRTVLSPQELEQLAPYLYYIDAELIRQQESANESYTDAFFRRSDPTKPEEMGDPIPVAVSLDAASEAFRTHYTFVPGAVMGICASSAHTDYALAFLRYCLN